MVAIIGILAAIAIPNLLGAQKRSRYSRAMADTKTLTTQTQLFANDKNAYPVPGTTDTGAAESPALVALRSAGYANVSSKDPWGTYYYAMTTPSTTPAQTDNYLSWSRGQAGTANSAPTLPITAAATNGTVGYSVIYGAWNEDTGP